MSKKIKLKDNNFWDTSSIMHDKTILSDLINKHFYGYSDTVGTDIKELLRNKIEYGLSLCTQYYETVMFDGGWSGHNFGFSIFSKNGGIYHVIWISTFGIYMCRSYNGTYTYHQISWTTIT